MSKRRREWRQKEDNIYTITSDEVASKMLFKDFSKTIEPIYLSYCKDKKTFVLQTVNFVLLFCLFHFVGERVPFLKNFTERYGNTGPILNTLFVALVVSSLSMINALEILKWQSVYKTDWKYTKRFFWRLVFVNVIGYWLKIFYHQFHLQKTNIKS